MSRVRNPVRNYDRLSIPHSRAMFASDVFLFHLVFCFRFSAKRDQFKLVYPWISSHVRQIVLKYSSTIPFTTLKVAEKLTPFKEYRLDAGKGRGHDGEE